MRLTRPKRQKVVLLVDKNGIKILIIFVLMAKFRPLNGPNVSIISTILMMKGLGQCF